MKQKKLVAVVGLGKTGQSCIHYLKSKNVDVVGIDSRSNPPDIEKIKAEFPEVKFYLGEFGAEIFDQVDALVVSPGISVKTPEIAAQAKLGKPVVGDIELFVQEINKPIVAITGSNGKSTVTALVGEMAKAAGLNVRVGGNIGIPVLEFLQEPAADLYVLELSSFQLETTYSLHAAAAIVLNVSPDHMDRYDDFKGYVQAKMRIYNNCEVAVVNRDESGQVPPLRKGDRGIQQEIRFGLEEPREGEFGITDNDLAFGSQKLLPIKYLKIKGKHQVSNALAALALGQAVSLPMPAMLQALQEFRGLPHRCQWVANIKGVDFYNDSKGTNTGATIAAIEGLGSDIEGKIVLIAGGQGKDADFSELYSALKKYVKKVVLIGEDAKTIANAIQNACEIEFAGSMDQAVLLAEKAAHFGDIVLLSPACASFDMFDNFEHRGEIFMEIVKNLK